MQALLSGLCNNNHQLTNHTWNHAVHDVNFKTIYFTVNFLEQSNVIVFFHWITSGYQILIPFHFSSSRSVNRFWVIYFSLCPLSAFHTTFSVGVARMLLWMSLVTLKCIYQNYAKQLKLQNTIFHFTKHVHKRNINLLQAQLVNNE